MTTRSGMKFRMDNTTTTTMEQQVSPQDNSSKCCYSYIAMRFLKGQQYYHQHQMAWIFYENQQEINQGVIVDRYYSSAHESQDADDLDFLGLFGAIQRVCSVGGFVAGFFYSITSSRPAGSPSDENVFAWVWDRIPANNKEFQQLWTTVQKCSLASFDLQLLVDDDIYKEFTLCELHQRVLDLPNDVEGPRDDDIFAEARMVGQCFYWFVTRYESQYLKFNFRPGSTLIQRNMALYRRVGHRKRIQHNRWWDTIDAFPSEEDQPRLDQEHAIKYMVLDVETHDWRDGVGISTRQTCIGRVVEMAWAAYDANGNHVERNNYLLRPHGYEKISDKARNFHGITTKCVREKGSDARHVFAHFVQTLRRIPPDGFVVAHNMNHEDAVMGNNLDEEGLRVWEQTPKCCTWNPRLLPLVFGNAYSAGRTYGMKLAELHKLVQSNGHALQMNAHSAIADVLMAWQIFEYMKRVLEEKQFDAPTTMRWVRG